MLFKIGVDFLNFAHLHVADLEWKWIDDIAVLPRPSYRSWQSSDKYQAGRDDMCQRSAGAAHRGRHAQELEGEGFQ